MVAVKNRQNGQKVVSGD